MEEGSERGSKGSCSGEAAGEVQECKLDENCPTAVWKKVQKEAAMGVAVGILGKQLFRNWRDSRQAEQEGDNEVTMEAVASREGSQMGELLGMQGDKPEVEQGLGTEAVQRWLNGAQGEGTVVPTAQQAATNGISNTNLARHPVMHLVENIGLDELPQYETDTVADTHILSHPHHIRLIKLPCIHHQPKWGIC